MTIKPNLRCNFCNLYTQEECYLNTQEECYLYKQEECYLFFECLDLKYFWLQLNYLLEKSGQMGVTQHIKNKLFGEETSLKLQNKIVILAKWYIYKSIIYFKS